MKKYKLGIIGSFSTGSNSYNGQTIKTKMIASALEEVLGTSAICCINSSQWRKHPLVLIKNIWDALKKCDSVILLPAGRGVKVIPRMTIIFNRFFHTKIYYSVIGGWLPNMLEKDKSLLKTLKKLDGIWVETPKMKTAMDSLGFTNISVVPNFKNIIPLPADKLNYYDEEPLALCTFSRVLKEKGIEDAIAAVNMANLKLRRTAFTLDIYGQIDKSYLKEFEELRGAFPDYIRYAGVVESNKSIEIIKNYFVLLFPTYYHGEGFAGTLIDAFSSGVPVIASNWAYNEEIVQNGVTGFIVNHNDTDDLCEKLIFSVNNLKQVNKMKSICLAAALDYSKEIAVKKMLMLMQLLV